MHLDLLPWKETTVHCVYLVSRMVDIDHEKNALYCLLRWIVIGSLKTSYEIDINLCLERNHGRRVTGGGVTMGFYPHFL